MSKKTDPSVAFNLYLNDLKKQKNDLMQRQNSIGLQIVGLTNQISKLSTLDDNAKTTYLDMNIKFYPEIPTRIKNLLNAYAQTKLNKDFLTAADVLKLGKTQISSISGLGKWSIIDLDMFFENKGYTWNDWGLTVKYFKKKIDIVSLLSILYIFKITYKYCISNNIISWL